MNKGIDYIYEYSDLNLLHTRVKILTGKYKDTILEFGGSVVVHKDTGGDFIFEYTIYHCTPENIGKLRNDIEFEKYLSELLIAIVVDRRNDPDDKEILDEILTDFHSYIGKIKIHPTYYIEG